MGFENTTIPSRRLPCAVKNRFNFVGSFSNDVTEADVIEMKLADYKNGVSKYGQSIDQMSA